MSVQLQVIPDEWTRLPPFTPGEGDVWRVTGSGYLIRVTLRAGELAISAGAARQLARSYADLARKAEVIAELGTLDPAIPAEAARAVRNGNSYRLATGGLVIQ